MTTRLPSRFEDLHRAERTMIVARWVAMVWAFVQVLVYKDAPYPPGAKAKAIALSLSYGAVNVIVWLAHRRTHTLADARALAIASLSMDILLTSALVWIYAFDQVSALWALLFIFPLEGALRFQLKGALGSWLAVTLLYIGREIWGSHRYNYMLQWNSISFRMGIALLIAVVAGTMARNLVRQRSRLAEAFAELENQDRIRARLVSTLAHDVRSPLTAISGATKTLIAREGQLDSQSRQQLLASVDRQSDRLQLLATNLLDLARMESGRLELNLETVVLEEQVRTALSFADPQGRIEVQIDPEIRVRCDPARLDQVFVNLGANMLRHGEPPFLVSACREGAAASIRFCDAGPGIPEDRRPLLFEPFLSKSSAESGGFGLAVVKALVEAHGGRVCCEANEPRGACFRVTLPFSGPQT